MNKEGYAASSPEIRRTDPLYGEITNILQWLVTALALALIFETFHLEPFQIPTGSMAPTLRGEHYALRCPRCGLRYDTGTDLHSHIKLSCPNCDYDIPKGMPLGVNPGDRIFVLKCIYQFFEPKRWDVAVFCNPVEPGQNYIKRVVGLEGESVEIIDGDIYIDGMIARKPESVQEQLWMNVYDNRFQGSNISVSRFSGVDEDGNDKWRMPFTSDGPGGWELGQLNGNYFLLDSEGQDGEGQDSEGQELRRILFDSKEGERFRSSYAYNDSYQHKYRPYCSDLMVRYNLRFYDGSGSAGACLSKYGREYTALIDSEGRVMLKRNVPGTGSQRLVLETVGIDRDREISFEFANVDHKLEVKINDEKITYDLGGGRSDVGEFKRDNYPSLSILGRGKVGVYDVAVFRDIHYIDRGIRRAQESEPFLLGEDEFFVCGDNSPTSFDSRLWAVNGLGNNGVSYRAGIVPRDYLLGKAAFVYWSEAFSLKATGKGVGIIPNFSGLKTIKGGR